MPAPVLQFKRGNAGVAGTVPALRPGEPAISLNNFDFFIGIDTSVANNKFFGSHRYWGREDGTTSLRLKLVDKGGSNSINLKSPDTLSGITTYTFPATPTNGFVLTTNANGDLSWTNSLPGGSFSGINTFTNTTDNTLGNSNTGAVQIDGGLGVDKNVTIGANLHVQGYSNFVGVVTFQGGTINLGDNIGDNISVGGRFASNLVPNTDNAYDVGISTLNWRHAHFSGIGTFETGAVIDTVQIGITAANEIDTTSGNLILDSAGGTIDIQDNVSTTGTLTVGTGVGITQFSSSVSTGTSTSSVPTSSAVINYVGTQIGNVDLTLGLNADTGGPSTVNTSQTLTINGTTNEVETSVSGQTVTVGLPNSVTITTALTTPTVKATNLQANDGTTAITITNSTGAVQTNSDLTVSGNLYVNGSTTQVNTASMTVEDRTIELGIVDGSAPSSSTTWDLGVLFNYHDGAAKKSALVWEQGDARFKLGSVVTDGGGTGNSNPQITLTTYAGLEIGELWLNNTCTGGSSRIIGCTGSSLILENITIDAGQF